MSVRGLGHLFDHSDAPSPARESCTDENAERPAADDGIVIGRRARREELVLVYDDRGRGRRGGECVGPHSGPGAVSRFQCAERGAARYAFEKVAHAIADR